MNTNLAIEIFKQATLETTTGACEKCPRKDKNKTCIGCLDNAKEQVLLEIERLNNIINELNYGIKELDNMFYETFRISQNGYYSISEWELKEFTDKLQELKGSDKE